MADDSEVKELPATPEEKPTGPISLIVRAPAGGVREMLKDPTTGRIVAKPKRMVSTLEITRIGRKFLDMHDIMVPDSKDPATKQKTKKRIERLFEAMYDIATNELAKTDPKYAMAASQAFEKLTRRIYGKESISDEDRGALERAGVKIVVIPSPQLMHPEVVKEHQENEKPLKPSFINEPEYIEAEIVTNEPEKKE